MAKRRRLRTAILAEAGLKLEPSADQARPARLTGSISAHHDSIVETHSRRGNLLTFQGELRLEHSTGGAVLLIDNLLVGNLVVEGRLVIKGLNIEQFLFLAGQTAPELYLSHSSRRVSRP